MGGFRRSESRAAVALVGLVFVLGFAASACGGTDEPSDTDQVRATLLEFGRATAAHDYKGMCERLAPALLEKLRQAGLPCERALAKGLGDVRAPKLAVGKITVRGDGASAEVRTSAEGQAPSTDTIELKRINGSWRIVSLGGSTQAGP